MQPCSFALFNALLKLEPKTSALQKLSVPFRLTVELPFEVKVFALISEPIPMSKVKPLVTVSPRSVWLGTFSVISEAPMLQY